jgi:hypothetical protein
MVISRLAKETQPVGNLAMTGHRFCCALALAGGLLMGAATPTVAPAQSSCAACLAGCDHQLLACQNSNLSSLSCRNASFYCAAACRRGPCAPGASQPASPTTPPRIQVPNVR